MTDAMLHAGINSFDGVPVEVTRKRVRRINLHVRADGTVCLSVPVRWATLQEGEAFLRAKWRWVVAARAKLMARSVRAPVGAEEFQRLEMLLTELNATWGARLGEAGVTWKIRPMTSLWGCCHVRKRHIVYAQALARAPRELVEYVVVHEFTHFVAHGHGPDFRARMDERLPGWQRLRQCLNHREWET